MKNEVIKQAFKLGNSAGVLLPTEWKNRKVMVKLIDMSISQEVFEILEGKGWLSNTMGIFLAGSYARGEETEDSDIDILVITDNINKQIKVGKYEIIFIPKDKIDKTIKTSLLISSLIDEAKPVLNNALLEFYKAQNRNFSIKKHLDDIKSMTEANENIVEMDREMNEKVSDGTLYSLILRLRELYLIECLKNNKSASNKKFISLIKKIASEESYNAYLRIKNDLRTKKIISVEEAMALINEIKKRLKKYYGKKK